MSKFKWTDYRNVQVLYDSKGYSRAVIVKDNVAPTAFTCIGPLGTCISIKETFLTTTTKMKRFRTAIVKTLRAAGY